VKKINIYILYGVLYCCLNSLCIEVQAQGWFQTYSDEPDVEVGNDLSGEDGDPTPTPDEEGSPLPTPDSGDYDPTPDDYEEPVFPTLSTSSRQLIYSIQKTIDKGYVGIGKSNDFLVLKMDQMGNRQWLKRLENEDYGGNSSDFDLAITEDNEYLLGILSKNGNQRSVYLQKLNAFGDTIPKQLLYTFTKPSNIYTFLDIRIIRTTDNNYILANYMFVSCGEGCEEKVIMITKVTATGEILWDSSLPLSQSKIDDLVATDDGGCVLSSKKVEDYLELARLDGEGNVVWQTISESSEINKLSPIRLKNDGNIIIGSWEDNYYGNIQEVSIVDGSVIQSLDFSDPANNIVTETFEEGPTTFYDINIRANGNILLAGVKQGEKDSLRVSELTPSWEFIENHHYPLFYEEDSTTTKEGFDNIQSMDLLTEADNSFTIGGRGKIRFNSQSGVTSVPYVLRFDKNSRIYTSQFCGTIYEDENQNCVQDADEKGIPNVLVSIEGTERFVMTDSEGNYCFNVHAGTYTLTTDLSSQSYWSNACDLPTITIVDDERILDVNVGYYPTETCPLLSVSIGTSLLQPCYQSDYKVAYCNEGALAENDAYVEVVLEDYLQIDSSSIAYVETAPNLYTFYVDTLDARTCSSFQIFTTVACDAPVLATACTEAHIYPDDYCGAIDPFWDGSDIVVDVVCEGDSVKFMIKNEGADMLETRSYGIYEDDLLEMMDDFYLNANDSIIISHPVDEGRTYRMQAETSPYAPTNNRPQATIEMCGGSVFSTGFVNTTSQNDTERFKDIDCQQIVETTAPNEKLVVPAGTDAEHYVQSTDELEYTIRFQNTYEDTIQGLYILDTLSTDLDINSFRSGSSSHPYDVYLLENNVVLWRLSDIDLPNDAMNESGSHGFIKFFVTPKTTVEAEILIENTAAIYFDFNAPELTTTTFVTICNSCVTQQYARNFHGKIYLEGAYHQEGLMKCSLTDFIPLEQPYTNAPYEYHGEEVLTEIPSKMIDWVLLEVRNGVYSESEKRTSITIETCAALLMEDGSIRDIDGISPVRFDNLVEGEEYRFCIRHRNHLAILSANPTMTMDDIFYDFTKSASEAFGPQQMKMSEDGFAMLHGGDFNQDGIIQASDYNKWKNVPAALNVYSPQDATLDGIIQLTDLDIWNLNKAKMGVSEIGF